jgi:hypothetical protein
MLPFGVTIPATVPQRSEIPEGLMNNPVCDGDLFSVWGFFTFRCAAAIPQLLLWHCQCTTHTQNGKLYIPYLWMWHSYCYSQKGHLYHTTSWYYDSHVAHTMLTQRHISYSWVLYRNNTGMRQKCLPEVYASMKVDHKKSYHTLTWNINRLAAM